MVQQIKHGEIIEKFKKENIINIKSYKQQNQGKMGAINNLIKYAEGELIIECDSDDYFDKNAFFEINKVHSSNSNIDNIYAYVFLKKDNSNNYMSKFFNKKINTMFDLYFKEGETGEVALVFRSNIRKKYLYELEDNEKFVTEARMYHKMDLDNVVLCSNNSILVCEYQQNGYTKNITKQFIENPKGYFNYFKEIFSHDTSKILLKKRLYIIKHYILFKKLSNTKNAYKFIKGIYNKIIYIILYIPGIIKIKYKFYNNIN